MDFLFLKIFVKNIMCLKRKLFFYIFLFIFVKEISLNLLRDKRVEVIKKKREINLKNNDLGISFKRNRYLEIHPKKFLQKITLVKNNETENKRLKMMKIISSILKNTKKKNLKIKNIKIGKNIRKMLNLDRSLTVFKTYLQDKNFQKNYKTLLSQSSKPLSKAPSKNPQKKKQKKTQKTNPYKKYFSKYPNLFRNLSKTRNLADAAAAGSAAATDDHTKFNFDSGFAGMPFPPFMMDGPTFHPPMNIKINAFPFPNPRAESPYEVAQENTKGMIKDYEDMNDKMDQVDEELSDTSMVLNNTLNELNADVKNELMKS